MKTVGFKEEQPVIDRISFRKDGYLSLFLEDGRILCVPLSRFPGIADLTAAQRKRYHIADGVIVMFEGDDEVYHIEEFLGSTVLKTSSELSTKTAVHEQVA
ncbi:hypothetical protein GCM10027299_13740 [Larkinella ripae]